MNSNNNQILIDPAAVRCDLCSGEATIFQTDGNFCLQCWQDRTEPDI